MSPDSSKRTFRNPNLETAIEFLLVVSGCAVAAAGFNIFMRPAGLASGGVVGISMLAERLTGLEPAFFQWGLNIPLLALAVAARGFRFGLKSALGSFLLPFFILTFKGLPAATDDRLLAAVFAGAAIGLGMGMVFRGKGSVGGLTIPARLISDATGVSAGSVLMALDGLVIGAAAILFGPETALYALIVVFVMGRVLDLVRVGFGSSKLALIISERHEEISAAVLNELDRGLTKLFGSGGYSGAERPVLLVVMDPAEIARLKAAVRAIDPNAFVVLIEAHEVLGLGFKSRL